MEMQDKLTFKKKRIDWLFIISIFGLAFDFHYWCKSHCLSIKSVNRKAYSFLKSVKGMSFIRFIRNHKQEWSMDEMLRIAKTPWIHVLEGD